MKTVKIYGMRGYILLKTLTIYVGLLASFFCCRCCCYCGSSGVILVLICFCMETSISLFLFLIVLLFHKDVSRN